MLSLHPRACAVRRNHILLQKAQPPATRFVHDRPCLNRSLIFRHLANWHDRSAHLDACTRTSSIILTCKTHKFLITYSHWYMHMIVLIPTLMHVRTYTQAEKPRSAPVTHAVSCHLQSDLLHLNVPPTYEDGFGPLHLDNTHDIHQSQYKYCTYTLVLPQVHYDRECMM